MQVTWGYSARDLKSGNKVPVVADTANTVNGHALIVGISAEAKYMLMAVSGVRRSSPRSSGQVLS